MLECPYVTTLTITHINWPLSKICPRYCSLKPNPPRPSAVDHPISIRIVNPQPHVHLTFHLIKHLLVVMLSSPVTLSLTPFSLKLIEWGVCTGISTSRFPHSLFNPGSFAFCPQCVTMSLKAKWRRNEKILITGFESAFLLWFAESLPGNRRQKWYGNGNAPPDHWPDSPPTWDCCWDCLCLSWALLWFRTHFMRNQR